MFFCRILRQDKDISKLNEMIWKRVRDLNLAAQVIETIWKCIPQAIPFIKSKQATTVNAKNVKWMVKMEKSMNEYGLASFATKGYQYLK